MFSLDMSLIPPSFMWLFHAPLSLIMIKLSYHLKLKVTDLDGMVRCKFSTPLKYDQRFIKQTNKPSMLFSNSSTSWIEHVTCSQ